MRSVDSSRAWAEVDLDAMASNLRVVRERIGPGPAILLVAKANAYGHGAIAVAHHALGAGAAGIAVTSCTEALELRRAGVRARLVVLGPVLGEEAPFAVRAGVEFALPSLELAQAVAQATEPLARPARVHVKVDTGLGRLGVPPDRALDLLRFVRASPGLELAGVLTHLAAPDGGLSRSAKRQLARFDRILSEASAEGLLRGRDVWVHALNSAGILSGLEPHYDAVRVGIAAFGMSPDARLAEQRLRPVLSVRTRVVHLASLRRGDGVGYGGTWTAARPSRVAVLPVGYDDGVNWRLSGKGSVLLAGRRVPIVGRVSMDYTTVDVTDVPGVELGTHATLIGRDGAEEIRIEELAALVGTIPYEVACSIGNRVTRTYVTQRPSLREAPLAV